MDLQEDWAGGLKSLAVEVQAVGLQAAGSPGRVS